MNLRSLLAFGAILALVLAACGGASSNEIKTAKTAHYKGDKATIFAAMKSAIEAKSKIDRVDEANSLVETTGRWYTPEGLAASERMDDIRDVPNGSIHIHFIVALVPDGDAFVVDVRPKWVKYISGSPKPEPLGEDDISVPGFAHEKVDAMVVAIHDALKSYEVQGVPAMVPAGSGATAPTPTPPAAPAPAPTPAPTP